MNQVLDFFKKLFDSTDWPPRWHCGKWTEFHGWLYIISDLMIWSAYFAIPIVIIRYISRKKDIQFAKLYFLFAAFILACGATHFLDAVAFWIPVYRLSALVRFITGVISWITVFYLVKFLPVIFSLRSQSALEKEIVERKKAEDALKKSKKNYELLVSGVKDYAIFLLDKNGCVATWNSGAANIKGYTWAEVIGKPMDIFYTQEELQAGEPRRNLQMALQHGRFETEGWRVRKDKSTFWANIILTPLFDEDHQLYGFAKVTRDITQRKKAEEALSKLNAELEQKVKDRTEAFRQSEEQYRLLFQNNPMPMWVIGLDDFKFLDVNEMAIFQYGYSRQEFLSMTAVDIRPEEDRAEFLQSDHSDVPDNQHYNKGIWRHRKKDGSIILVEINAHTILFEGIPARLILAHDVTEQQQAEEKLMRNEKRFRALVENTDDIIGLLNEKLVHLYRSPSSERITGYTLEERLKSGAMGEVHPEDNPGFQNSLEEVRANPGKAVPVTYRLKHKDGHYIWLEGSFTNLLHDPAVGAIVANVRDVTERKELEDLLHKANTLARIGSWEVDLEKGTVYWTDITRDIHEVEVDYIPNLETGINFYKQGKGRDLIKQKVNEAIEAGKPWDVELQIITAKNNERWIRSIGQTEFKHGKCIRIFGSFQDIDMRKKAEEKLIASELQFRSTLDNMLEGAQIIGFDWRYIYINDSLARHAKYNRDEMIGYTVMEKFPGIEQTAIYNVYQRCFNERVSIHLENEFHFPDGSTGWFELSFQPVPEGIFILSIDITERKKAEQAILSAEANYREIFEKASDAIYVHEIDTGKVIEVNQRATEITGYTKEEIITGNPQDMLTDNPLYSMEYAFDYLQKAAAGMPQLFDWLSKNKDGSHNWLEVNLKKANIAGEERILAFFREINDRKKAQLEVQKLNEELEQKVIIRTEQLRKTNEELEAFSYSVSHDLRAPLRAIIGFSAILQEEYINKLDDEAKRITGIIINNTKKMGQLIDDLLSFSRLGRQPIVKTTVHTNVMIEDIIAEMDFKNSNKQPDWSIATLPDIKADTNAIRQVWVNLISNAVKYSNKNNNPVIEIGSRQEKNETVFFIKDNGVGFDTKYKDKLFKVFQRLHSAAEFEGTGVGLAIVEKIITRHGGRVWAEAIINNGACFYFSLPNE